MSGRVYIGFCRSIINKEVEPLETKLTSLTPLKQLYYMIDHGDTKFTKKTDTGL